MCGWGKLVDFIQDVDVVGLPGFIIDNDEVIGMIRYFCQGITRRQGDIRQKAFLSKNFL